MNCTANGYSRQPFAPSIEAMRLSLPDVGQSLEFACCELSRDCTVPRLDELIARLRAAENNLIALRRAMMTAEQVPSGS